MSVFEEEGWDENKLSKLQAIDVKTIEDTILAKKLEKG